jgi:hypothetical protein
MALETSAAASPPGAARTRAAADAQIAAARRTALGSRAKPRALAELASRMLVAQAGALAAIGLGYSRRNVPWLSFTVVAAIALCGLAYLVRSGGHATWLVAVSVEAFLVALGLIRFAYARYMGGSLLAIISLGVLLHPAVADAFARVRQREPAEFHDVIQGGGRAADGALATILTQGIPPEGAALSRERA